MADLLFLVKIENVLDPRTGDTRTLYYAFENTYTLRSSETPANQPFLGVVKQPTDIWRSMFSPGATMGPSKIGIGDLVLDNANFALDDLGDYGFDAAVVTVYSAPKVLGVQPAFPGDFQAQVFTCAGPAVMANTTVTLSLRDKQKLWQVPFQRTKYTGANVLPAGLEGTSELTGKPKPVLYGVRKKMNIPCVNASKLIYQINDGAINSVDAVYDRGIALTNGIATWTSQTSGFGANGIFGLAFGNSIYIAVGDAGTLYTSPDKVTWTSRTSGFGASRIYGVAFGNGLFVAVGAAGKLFTSTDGITWTTRTSTFGATDILCVAYVNSLWIIGGASGTLASSTNGTSWTSRTSTISGEIRGIAYGVVAGVGRYVIVGGGPVGVSNVSEGATSTNGTSWTTAPSLAEADSCYMSAAFGQGVFVASTFLGSISVSPDGKTYSTRPSGYIVAKIIDAVAYNSVTGTFLFSGGTAGTGAVASAPDAALWTLRTTGAADRVRAILPLSDGGFMIAGDTGGLFTSAGVTTYSSQADLLDDSLAPAPGTYGVYLAGGYIRLGFKPVGLITCDATQGATSADRTAAQIFVQVADRIDETRDSGDITALDSDNSSEIGFWSGVQEWTMQAVADMIAGTPGAAWWYDGSGALRIARLEAPTLGTETHTFTANDVIQGSLVKLIPKDDTKGIPAWKITVRWGQYDAVQTTDLASGVDDATRADLAHEWRDATAEDDDVLANYPLSPALEVESLFSDGDDAQDEADRLLALRSQSSPVPRGLFEFKVQLNDVTRAIDIGDVVMLVHDRYALSVVGDVDNDFGGTFRVLDVEPDAKNRTLTLRVWGNASGSRNRVTTAGALRVSTTGAYRITRTA